MSRKVIVCLVLPTERMGEHMISLPVSLYDAATNVATTSRLLEYILSLRSRKRIPDHLIAECQLLSAPLLSQCAQASGEILSG